MVVCLTGFAAVDHLIKAVDELNLEITHSQDRVLTEEGYVLVHIEGEVGAFSFIVDDEYSDISQGRNTPQALNAVLLTILDVQDGHDDPALLLKQYRGSMEAFWSEYKKRISNPEITVSPLAWQINDAEAQALRSYISKL